MSLRLLVTGAAGSVGRRLVLGLTEAGVEVRGLDRETGQGVQVVADLADTDALDAALTGTDAVVQLAAIPTETDLATALDSHVLGTWHVLEAMRRTGVRRIVLASSNHAVGMHERPDTTGGNSLGTDVRPRPDTCYGVAKVASEALCSLYVDRHGLEAVCLRIGSVLDRPTSRRALSTWLSPADAVRLVHAAAAADLSHQGGFAVAWGVSANTRGWWDPAPGRALGYAPQDDAEAFAADVETTPATDRDTAEGLRVGGPFTLD